MEKQQEELKFVSVISRNFDREQMNELTEKMKSGNIPAYLEIIMHNQLVLNEKLNKLLKRPIS